AFWPTDSLRPVDISNHRLPPTLLFQATNDAATPYEGGVTVHQQLRGSSLVVEQGGGNHGITLSGNACLDKYLATYLTDGKVPRGDGEADAVCKTLPDPKPLTTKAASTSARGSALHGLLGFRGDPARAVRALGDLGHPRLLTEGGPRLLGQLIAADVLDEMCLTLSPMLAAGESQRIAGGPPVPLPRRFELVSLLEEAGFVYSRYRRP
ncbi:alpha/beta hydrolase, partial [Streptomyces halstedii]|uniref:alpha/beta hydrolase n=1 Tax=Streptomyces halstedii TaxID=1944 RepID=UPI00335C7B0B